MTNKEQIKKLRDNAELAWVAYGYFHLADKNYKPEGWWNKDKKRLEEFRKIRNKELKQNNIQIAEVKLQDIYPTPTDILNINYKSIFEGDMSPTQAQNFTKRYDLLIHQPNTSSGFPAAYKSQRLCQCSQL